MEKLFNVERPSSVEEAGERGQKKTGGEENVSESDDSVNPDLVEKGKGDPADVEADDKAGDDPEYMDTGKGDSNDEEAEDSVDHSDHGDKGKWSFTDEEEDDDVIVDPDYVTKVKGRSRRADEDAEDDAGDDPDSMDTDRGGSDNEEADGNGEDDGGTDEEESNDEEMEDNAEADSDFAGTDGEEEEEPDDVCEDNETSWRSKDGKLTWFPTQHGIHCRQSAVDIPTPGPTRYARTRVTDIKSSFDIFMTDDILKIVLDMTNLQGRRVHANWKDIDMIDLKAYIGLLIIAGVYRSKHEAILSLWDPSSGRPIFQGTMPRKTFYKISSVIRFDDPATRSERRQKDKLAAIRDVWDKWVCRLPMIFNPGPDVSVDERLVPFRGHCPFRQYMPSKPAKYGIKIWAACDAKTTYAWNMQVYTGKSADEAPETNQGMRVVMDMTSGLRGHNVTCDNFFTSYALGQALQPELPRQLLATTKRDIHSSVFMSTDTQTLVSYIPKKGKNVVLLSTKHRDAAVSDREDKKPHMILDYNQTKGGVDNLDKVTGTYSCKRMTRRWPLSVFYNIIDVSAYNAFVVWTEIDPSWNQGISCRRRLFLAELGKALVTPQMQRRKSIPRGAAAASMVRKLQGSHIKTKPKPIPIPKHCTKEKARKRCDFCVGRKIKRPKIATTCAICQKSICKGHAVLYCEKCAPKR